MTQKGAIRVPYFVGLDLGTSASKAAVFTGEGFAIGRGKASCAVGRAPVGAAEVQPEDWWAAAVAAVRSALAEAGVRAADVQSIGLSGQIGNQVLLDEAHRVLRPAMIWQDTRAAGEAQELLEAHGRDVLFEWLGIDLPAGANWPAPRLLWLSRHEPEILANTRHLVQAKDYLLHRLTGELVSDLSSWRGLLHQASGKPAAPLLAKLGLSPEALPTVLPPDAVGGRLTANAAEALGLRPGTPVAVGWNDLNCAILGGGSVRPGDAFDVGGTSEHLGKVLNPSPLSLAPPGLMRAPYLESPVVYGVTSAGGGSLAWYGGVVGSVERVLSAAAQAPAGSDGLVFLPYLNGERSPIWDGAARGVFFGLSGAHEERHLARAVLEGVAYSLRQVLQQVEAAAGPITTISVSGGPSRSPLWNRIKASAWGRSVIASQEPNAGCLGAAMLAASAAGFHKDPLAAAEAMSRPGTAIEPEPDWAAVYDRYAPIFQSLYPALRTTFQSLQQARN